MEPVLTEESENKHQDKSSCRTPGVCLSLKPYKLSYCSLHIMFA